MKNEFYHSKEEELFDLLKKSLAYNYLSKRYSESEGEIHEIKKNVQTRKKVENEYFEQFDKIIVIVGAGLSSEVGFPTGYEAAEIMKEKLTNPEDRTISKEYLTSKIEEIRLRNNQEEEDFETIIEALSEYPITEKKVKDTFSKMFSSVNSPVLGYEILAHWLKNQMIDAIINFNFDELLDDAISEEFVHEDYKRLIGGSDYSVLNEYQASTLPLYIKPHGTVSDPDSIRATRDHYLRNTEGFQKIFNTLFTGKVLFLTIGYNMASIELNQLLEDRLHNTSREINHNMDFSPNSGFDANFICLKRTEVELKQFSNVNSKIKTLNPKGYGKKYGSNFLRDLNEQLAFYLSDELEDVEGAYGIRGIERHLLTCKLFSNPIKLSDTLDGKNKILICTLI